MRFLILTRLISKIIFQKIRDNFFMISTDSWPYFFERSRRVGLVHAHLIKVMSFPREGFRFCQFKSIESLLRHLGRGVRAGSEFSVALLGPVVTVFKDFTMTEKTDVVFEWNHYLLNNTALGHESACPGIFCRLIYFL